MVICRRRGTVTLAESAFATFDGDTAFEVRANLLKSSRVLLTNPDTIHMSLIPAFKNCQSFLSRVRFIIVDEVLVCLHRA